jgi:Protein of unknown function (DUF3035)
MIMKRTFTVAAPLVALLALSGCSTVNEAATDLWNWDIRDGSQPQQPTTGRVAPLMVPPDYSLQPVQAAPVRSQDGGQEQVLDALFGGAAPRSNSERAVIGSAGTADPGIRSTVGDPETVTVNKGSITRDIIAAPEGDGQSAQAAIPE